MWELGGGPPKGERVFYFIKKQKSPTIKSTGCSAAEFNFQRSHGDSQLSLIGSDAIFWPAFVHVDRTFNTVGGKEGRREGGREKACTS